MTKRPDNSGFMQDMSDDEIAEWSFRSLVRSLLKSEGDISEPQDYARRLLETGAEGTLRRIAAITDSNDRVNAFEDAEMLIEASLRIALYDTDRAKKAAENSGRRGGRPPSTDPEIIRAEVFRLMTHHGEFTIDDEVWNAQARLEQAIRNYLSSDLSESRLRELIVPHLAEWRAQSTKA